jgi:hypothetical protein
MLTAYREMTGGGSRSRDDVKGVQLTDGYFGLIRIALIGTGVD